MQKTKINPGWILARPDWACCRLPFGFASSTCASKFKEKGANDNCAAQNHPKPPKHINWREHSSFTIYKSPNFFKRFWKTRKITKIRISIFSSLLSLLSSFFLFFSWDCQGMIYIKSSHPETNKSIYLLCWFYGKCIYLVLELFFSKLAI